MTSLGALGRIGRAGFAAGDQAGAPPPAWSPAALFAASELGAWYDPSDLSTLWQDTAGTTPVTATGQLVARMDDKSGNGNHVTQATEANRPSIQQDGSGKYYLSYDGVNDSLFITSSALAIIGDLFVISGVYKTSAAAYGHIACSMAATTANNAFEFRAGNTSGAAVALQFSAADTAIETDSTGINGVRLTQETTSVFDITRYVGTELVFNIVPTYESDTGTETEAHTKVPTNGGTQIFALGARLISPLYLNGRIYQCVVIDRTATESEYALVRSFVADKAGVTL